MILPHAGDFQISLGIAFLGEARALQQRHGGGVGGQARGLKPVEPQVAKGKVLHQLQGF